MIGKLMTIPSTTDITRTASSLCSWDGCVRTFTYVAHAATPIIIATTIVALAALAYLAVRNYKSGGWCFKVVHPCDKRSEEILNSIARRTELDNVQKTSEVMNWVLTHPNLKDKCAFKIYEYINSPTIKLFDYTPLS